MYDVIEGTFYLEDYGEYTSYGILLNCEGEPHKVSDISLNRDQVEDFCKMLNSNSVSPNDLDDYIEDFLARL